MNSTPLAGRFDVEEWHELMGAYYDTCTKVIARYDGHVALYLGDGLLVYFGYPYAHEDDAQRAVRAGLGIIEAVRRLDAVVTAEHGASFSVRVGCHTGPVVIGEAGDRRHGDEIALGETPHIAARLQSVAEPNTLVIGALTHQLLGGAFSCISLGTPHLKGVATPLEVFHVLNESTARTRVETLGDAPTPLVGRQRELDQLQRCWAEAISGRGRVALVGGEAGIGKSRLARALADSVADDGAWLTLCQCSPYYQQTALFPVTDLIKRSALNFDRQETVEQRMRALEGFLVQHGFQLESTMPLFMSLLSLPPSPRYPAPDITPSESKALTLEALLTILVRRAERQPVLFVVEDLHWVDPTTQELLDIVVNRISESRILAMFTYRPDIDAPWPDDPSVERIRLGRMAEPEVTELTHLVAGGKSLPGEVMHEVVTKTDGVPLFVEELTKMLLESDMLEEHHDRFELTGHLQSLTVPSTLHDSLMARLDRLAEVKWLAQLAATLGRDFSYRLLKAVSGWNDDRLCETLERLVSAEFLHQRHEPPRSTYRFKHALIQEAAYHSLLKTDRQVNHQRIAGTLCAEFTDVVSAHPELLAHHYTAAGLTEKAIPYWLDAARLALQRYANHEAISHASRGLELLEEVPKTARRDAQELSLLLQLGPAQSSIAGPHSCEHIFARARELGRRAGTSAAELSPALAGLANAKIVRGDMTSARSLANESLALAVQQDDSLILAAAHWMVAYVAFWQGDFTDTRDHSRKGLDHYQPDQHVLVVTSYNQNPGIVCGYLDALARWALGYPTQAAIAMERTVAHARELGHPFSVGMSLLFSAQLAQLCRDAETSFAHADEALQIGAKHRMRAVELWCLLPRGWALVQQGDVAAGIADIREAMERRRKMGMGSVWPWFLTLYADACGSLGKIDEGLQALDEATTWVLRNDERLYAAEVSRTRGELLLLPASPDEVQAQRFFDEALTTARRQHAKSFELRAAISMARLWRRQGRFDDAHALLSPVYGWFAEGWETQDLRDARALLVS
ncbi:AAA family ATPase [Mycolicibacterium xanthum]|uniref:AAA family ATPase n=1 Tax=Mycolicibacterium xanthum TaxID=2796469 RepID=UPI0027DF4A87|nr:AAA family ATPase [Mycolicibacterium xanthum]